MHVFQQENYPPKGLIPHHFLYFLNRMEKKEKVAVFGCQDHASSLNWYTDLLTG